jgi:hypothetical protein
VRGVADEQHGTARPGVKDDLLNRAGLPGVVAGADFVERVEQGGHRLGVPGQKFAQRRRWGRERSVAVAVHPSVADRDRQKRRVLTEQHRPRRRDFGPCDDEAARILADRARRRGIEDQPPHRRVQSVRAQDEVVAANDAVAELDCGTFVVDGHRLRAMSPPDRHVTDPGEQHLMQLCPMQRQAGADTVPHVRHLDVEEQASAAVGEALSLNAHRELGHLRAKPETVEGTYRVTGQVDPGALAHRRGRAFDDLDRRAPTAQRASRRQPGNAGTDDENSNTVTPHVPPNVCGLGQS